MQCIYTFAWGCAWIGAGISSAQDFKIHLWPRETEVAPSLCGGTLLLSVWSMDQEHWHLLGTYYKCGL